MWLWGGFESPSRYFIIHHSSFCLRPSMALTGLSMLGVGCWMLDVFHKHPEYSSPFPSPSGWSGGTLVPPWYLPIPIEHPESPIFNQASLSKSLSRGLPAVKRFSGLDVGSWMMDVRCAIHLVFARGSHTLLPGKWPSNPDRSSTQKSCASRRGPSAWRSAWGTGSPWQRVAAAAPCPAAERCFLLYGWEGVDCFSSGRRFPQM